MFVDPDAVEELMGVRVEDMAPMQLVVYLKTVQRAFDIDLVVQDPKDRKIFEELQKLYGKETAGRIVKWVVYKHKGQFRGNTVMFSDFCKARKWWTDLMHTEMQKHMNKQKPPSASRVQPGVRVLDF